MNIQPDKVERAKAVVVVARGLSNKLPSPANVRYPTTKSDADSEPDKEERGRFDNRIRKGVRTPERSNKEGPNGDQRICS